jgi:uncharacterized Fe-S cluster protein YjdI
MKNTLRYYSNEDITVFWIPSKCSHATTCFRELIEVFNPRKRPWVNMQGASTDRIIAVVDKCPTMALSWKYNKDIKDYKINANSEAPEEITPEDIYKSIEQEKKPGANISLIKNGPILVEGTFKIISQDGNELKSVIMTSFCRCGKTKAQPFCDGTHRKVGFKD